MFVAYKKTVMFLFLLPLAPQDLEIIMLLCLWALTLVLKVICCVGINFILLLGRESESSDYVFLDEQIDDVC